MAYNFQKQLKIGEYFEKKIDEWLLHTSLKNFKALYPVDMSEQRLGFDRFALDEHGHKHSLEYKTDLKAHLTENLFLETEVDGKPGWIHKCIANEIYVYIPRRGDLLQYDMKGIRRLLLDHSNQRELVVKNEGFSARGIIVSLKIAKGYAVNCYYRKCLKVSQEELDGLYKEVGR